MAGAGHITGTSGCDGGRSIEPACTGISPVTSMDSQGSIAPPGVRRSVSVLPSSTASFLSDLDCYGYAVGIVLNRLARFQED